MQAISFQMDCPSPKHSLDRLDNNGDYSPDNTAWRTLKQQANNKRSNVIIEYQGKKMTMSEWSNEIGLPYKVIRDRFRKLAWNEERVLNVPLMRNKFPKKSPLP